MFDVRQISASARGRQWAGGWNGKHCREHTGYRKFVVRELVWVKALDSQAMQLYPVGAELCSGGLHASQWCRAAQYGQQPTGAEGTVCGCDL